MKQATAESYSELVRSSKADEARTYATPVPNG
jgi:hypothetical protein